MTTYLYDRQHVILETKGNDSIRYVRGNNYIARLDGSDKLSYFLYNGHGDVVQTVSEAGEIENQYDFDIFGNPTLTVEEYSNSIRYAGEFCDVETGLYYLRARYYDPYIGRFISEDSYWGEDTNPLSLNLYTYCHNDPIQFIDPSGHWQESDNSMNSDAKAKISKYTDDYNKAKSKGDKAGMDKAHADAEALREAYKKNSEKGNSGGSSSGGSSSKGGSSNKDRDSKDSNKVTVTWEGHVVTVDKDDPLFSNWAIYQGDAYASTMYVSSDADIDEMSVAAGDDVNIVNRGHIGSIHTGEGSYTVIDNEGNVGTIVTGVGSTTTINNAGKVTSIKTGDSHSGREKDSKTTIINYDTIGSIETGKNSDNDIIYGYKVCYVNGMQYYKDSHIGKITTGEGNETMIYADRLEEARAATAGQQGGSIYYNELSSQGTGEPKAGDTVLIPGGNGKLFEGKYITVTDSNGNKKLIPMANDIEAWSATYKPVLESHETLDMAGMSPGLNIADGADLVNAGWYALQGDSTNAYISFLATFNDAATGARYVDEAGEIIDGMNKSKLPWGSWGDYEKVTVNGQDYAKIGDRLYSHHAVDRMQPSGFKYPHGQAITQAGGDYGRSVAPQYVEDVIKSVKPIVQENGNLKYVGGSLEVITNPQGAVVTIMTK